MNAAWVIEVDYVDDMGERGSYIAGAYASRDAALHSKPGTEWEQMQGEPQETWVCWGYETKTEDGEQVHTADAWLRCVPIMGAG